MSRRSPHLCPCFRRPRLLNIYGTTFAGGMGGGFVFGHGVVYELNPAGNETILYAFTGGLDGGNPGSAVTLDSAGNLYGTTYSGGPPAFEFPGVVWKIDSTGHKTTVYAFQGTTDGNTPSGGVILDAAGNLYGTTQGGGQGNCSFLFGCGVVFEVDPGGHETVLYSFTGGSDGSGPTGGVIRDSVGNLYGTAGGGAAGAGVVYKISATAIP